MSWINVIQNEIWKFDHFFDEKILAELIEKMTHSEIKILEGSKTHLVSSGYYNYNLHSWGLRQDDNLKSLRKYIFDKINDLLFDRVGLMLNEEMYNPIQIFSKSFNANSHYELHTEPDRLFGSYAFVVFLTDEVEGALNFVSSDEIEGLLSSPLHSRKAWEENVHFLRNDNQEVRYIGPLKILPQKNTCFVFKTGSAHYVDPIHQVSKLSKTLIRPCITGWPYAFGFEKYLTETNL